MFRNNEEFRAGLTYLLREMVKDSVTLHPITGNVPVISASRVEATNEFITDCLVAAGVNKYQVQIDIRTVNDLDPMAVLDATVSLDGAELCHISGVEYWSLAQASWGNSVEVSKPTLPTPRDIISVEVKVLDEELYWGKDIAPKGSEDSAGIDLMAAVTEDTYLEPGETKLIPTGLAFFLKNPNYVGLIHPRSGLGHKHGIVLGNLTGVIDADYNGQLMVSLWNRNTTGEPFKISRGDRIAQFLIQPVVMGLFQQVNEFSTETDRGGNGFGASGLGQQVTTHRHVSKPSEVKPVNLELPEAVKDKTFGERMNETRPRVFKKEGVFTKEEMAANTSTIMDNLQVVIDAHQGVDYVAEELSEEQLERVIKWALEYIDGCGGDSTIVKVVVERTQDWNHEAGQLFNRRANMNLFYGTENRFVRITNPAANFILQNYVEL
jgi:dUTP pyrophosphatase